ncbi:MAG: NADPH-dependent F420 reductase [Actinomycetota bacterium]
MRVAIVGGTGDEGFALARRLASAGEDVVIGSREEGRGANAAAEASAGPGDVSVEGTENAKAVASADVVFVTVPYAGQAAIYRDLKEEWPDGVVVCDTTTPLASAVGDRAWRVLRPWEGSAAEQAKQLLPDRVRFVAGFHTVGARPLADLDAPVEADVLLCGDDDEAKAVVGDLVDRIPGLRWLDCGPLSVARIVEPLTALLISVNRRYRIHGAGVRLTGREAWGTPPTK